MNGFFLQNHVNFYPCKIFLQQEPFVYKYENCDDHDKNNKYSRCFKGYCIDLLIKIQEELNFNYTIRNVTGYGYMGEKSPHEWDGMVKELKDRVQLLNFLLPYGIICLYNNFLRLGKLLSIQ